MTTEVAAELAFLAIVCGMLALVLAFISVIVIAYRKPKCPRCAAQKQRLERWQVRVAQQGDKRIGEWYE